MVLALPAGADETLSAAQIAGFAKQAGFAGPDLTTAVAVALAESSGRTGATNKNRNGSTDYGLWQINDKAHPDLITDTALWFSPVYNAQMAFKVYQAAGNKFTPWSTYPVASSIYLAQASAGAANPTDPGLVQAHDGSTDKVMLWPWQPIVDAVSNASKWASERHNWVRAAFVGIGGVMLIGAVFIAAKPILSPAAGKAADLATKVAAPEAGVAKTAARAAAKGGK